MCEPAPYSAEEVDIREIREELKPFLCSAEIKAEEKVESAVQAENVVKEQEEEEDVVCAGVLPLHPQDPKHLNDILSLKKNAYLRCKWDKFLNNPPEHYVNLREYGAKEPQPVKRMHLSGAFYDHNNRPAPIPYEPDPRQFWLSMKELQKKQMNLPDFQKNA